MLQRRRFRLEIPIILIISVVAPGSVIAQNTASPLWECALDGTGSPRAMVCSGSTVYVGGDFTIVGPNSGGGVALSTTTALPASPNISRIAGTVSAVVSDGAGGWFIGGTFTAAGRLGRGNLAHVLADGSMAPWDPDANGPVKALARIGQTVYVGGAFTTVGGQSRTGLAALDATTGAALAWSANTSSLVNALLINGSTLYVGGGFGVIGGQARNGIAALDAGTGAVQPWDPDADGQVFALAMNATTVYVGGTFAHIGGQPRSFVAALDAATGAATSWAPSPDARVTAFAISGPALYVGGSFTHFGGQTHQGLAKVDVASGTVTPWNAFVAECCVNGTVTAIAVVGSTVFAGSDFLTAGGLPRPGIAAFDAVTGAVTAWDPHPMSGTGYQVRALATSGSTIYLGGVFRSAGGRVRNHAAAFDAVSGTLSSWDPNADGSIYALALSGSTIYAGGSFSHIGGQTRSCIAALGASDGAANGWNPNANNIVTALAVSGSTVYAGGSFLSVNGQPSIGGQPRDGIAALEASSGIATAGFTQGVDRGPFPPQGHVLALAVSGPNVYAAGSFTQLGGQPRNNLAALDGVTGLATSWDPSAGSTVYTLLISGALAYAGGGFQDAGGFRRTGLAALTTSTGVATFWDPTLAFITSPAVYALATQGQVLYASGQFDHVDGLARPGLVAFSITTGAVTPWDPSGMGIEDRAFSVAAGGSIVYACAFPGLFAFRDTGALQAASVDPGTTLNFTSHPNPVRESTTLRFSLPAAATVSLRVLDAAGRTVAMPLAPALATPGPHEVGLRMDRMNPGLYFAELMVGSTRLVRKLALMR